MSNPLVECIPNFSDARRPEVVQSLMDTISGVAGVSILDKHSDLDHNRTVITFAGSPQAVEEAAFQVIRQAASLIDLNQHTGEHPRIGATDVVPFVPLRNITMQECIEMARRLGYRVGSELSIPVYLYEEAATQPERKNLENIRKGQYEGLREIIATDPERTPDYGPMAMGPAGAVVIGARQPLIAFNVYLTTNEVSIAQKIAKVIRHSSGGLHYLKALGLLVDGRAQVTMNFTNYHQTSIARAVEMIRREAERYSVGIHHSELVGLIPLEAIVESSAWYLQLNDFLPEQVLEYRLYQMNNAPAEEVLSIQDTFIQALASPNPVPAGGSASANVAAQAAALLTKIARITLNKKKASPSEQNTWAILEKTEKLRKTLLQLEDADVEVYKTLISASRMPKNTLEQTVERNAAIQSAVLDSIQPPLSIIICACEILEQAVTLADYCSNVMLPDLNAAVTFAQAALSAASLIVRANLSSLNDIALEEKYQTSLSGYTQRAQTLYDQLQTILKERGATLFA
jgi:glutamate formiminotransferase/formiminotetrahydrofolate cyclodeaminase